MKGLVKGIPTNFENTFVGTITNYAIDVGVMGREIPFVFSPDSLSDTVSASYTQTNIPGSSAPQITYSSTGARQLSFSLNLPLDYLPPNSMFRDFEDYLNAFRALVYPKYSLSGGKVESPHCRVVLSNVDIDGVCTQCSIEYKTDRYANDGSMSAGVSLSFIEVLDNVSVADAKWIANSKVKVLRNTKSTTQNYTSTTYTQQSSSDTNTSNSCYVKIIGDTRSQFNYKNGSLADAEKKGVWTDLGCTYTNREKYSIKKLFGYQINAIDMNISNIKLEKYGSWTCEVNGRKVNLSTSTAFTESPIALAGDVVNYFEIYLPYYDGNRYEIESSKIKYINIKVVK